MGGAALPVRPQGIATSKGEVTIPGIAAIRHPASIVAMTNRKRIKSLSETTRGFLSSGEGQLVDFKRAPDGVSAEDLVAFANAAEGGTILAGVGEQTLDGAQVGLIIGCEVGDNAILQLLNKAISCLPPVSIDIAIENMADKPILRIEVPPSPTKPHCTPKGIYCRRDGARNRALHPTELLRIFLETEAQVFAERFESAADHITQEIGNLEASLESTINNMASQLGWAESNLDDTSSAIDTVLAYTKRIDGEAADIATRMRAIFRQDEREDPVRDRERKKLTENLVKEISEDASLQKVVLAGRGLSFKLKGKPALELTSKDGEAALAEAYGIIREREDRKNYRAVCVRPAECEPGIIDKIAAAVRNGGDAAELKRNILVAFRIGYTTYKKTIVAVIGLRKPPVAARAALFARAGADADHKTFKIQLDWVTLDPGHHGKGQLTKLIGKVLEAAEGKPLFALVRVDEEIVCELLLKAGFMLAATRTDAPTGGDPVERLYLREGR